MKRRRFGSRGRRQQASIRKVDVHTLKVTYSSLDGKVRRENTFVLNANGKSISENGRDACAFGFKDDVYAAHVVGGVGTDRAAQVSDEIGRCGGHSAHSRAVMVGGITRFNYRAGSPQVLCLKDRVCKVCIALS